MSFEGGLAWGLLLCTPVCHFRWYLVARVVVDIIRGHLGVFHYFGCNVVAQEGGSGWWAPFDGGLGEVWDYFFIYKVLKFLI